MAVTLSSREKKQWEEIKTLAQNNDCLCLDDADAIRMKRVLDLLQEQGYIKSLDVDGTNMFLVLGNFQDFDEWLKDKGISSQRATTAPASLSGNTTTSRIFYRKLSAYNQRRSHHGCSFRGNSS